MTLPLTPAQFESLIPETFLREVLFFEETDSTNTRALELLSRENAPPLPLLIATGVQRAGRGRGSNAWWSSDGSLTFTLVIDTTALGLAVEDQPRVSLLAGLSLLDAGHARLPRANFAVKWPNDLYLEGRKLAGILVEVAPRRPACLIVGIGVNVNTPFETAPEELRKTGISLRDVAGQEFDRIALLRDWLRGFERSLAELSRGEFDLRRRWADACLLTGKRVSIQTTPGAPTATGQCLGISPEGAILLQTESGIERLFGGIVLRWE